MVEEAKLMIKQKQTNKTLNGIEKLTLIRTGTEAKPGPVNAGAGEGD